MDDEIFIGELARLCGVSPDTIRHYERLGVIPAAVRGPNGYRRYPRATADRVLLIRRAIGIGFSLVEIGRILGERDAGRPPCRGVRAMADGKLADLQRRIDEMIAMRDELVQIVRGWDERLAATREGEPAHLLQSLKETPERGSAGFRRSTNKARPGP